MLLRNIKKPQNLKDLMRFIIMFVCICVLIYSLFMLTKKLYGYYHDNKQYEQIRAQVSMNHSSESFSNASDSSDAISMMPETSLPYTLMKGNIAELNSDGILNRYAALKKQNDELVGWIQLPGFKTPIDYPVMQAQDNNFYLQNDFYKNFSYAGSIFMDFRNNALQVGRHTILYGHAMNNRSMFGNLKEFPKRPEDYTKITKVYLDLLNTRLEFEIFSIYFENASTNYRQTSFLNDDEYMAFLETIRSKSVYNYNVTLTPMDKIITLSTCNSNLGQEMRSVTHARLVRQVIYDGLSDTSSEVITSEGTEKNIISANTYLAELSLNYGEKDKTGEAVFTPAFSTAIDSPYKTFSTLLAPEVETVFLTYKTADPQASVSVTVNDKKADPLSLKLEQGQNVIKIKVVSRDTLYSRIYTINITRQPESTTEAALTAKAQANPEAEQPVLPE